MLSFIVQLASRFERRHGVRPNLLYLSYDHFRQLRAAFAGDNDLADILARLDMELVLGRDVVHPRVAWSPVRAQAV